MDERKTLTVPEAGRVYFDLGRNASYEAARRGDFRRSKLVDCLECRSLRWSGCSRPRYRSTDPLLFLIVNIHLRARTRAPIGESYAY
jgi:hypothetical protein